MSILGLTAMDPCAHATRPPTAPTHPQKGARLLHGCANLPSRHRHLLLVIFLPPLLFESAYAMDNAIFDTQFWQIFALAIRAQT